jgi:hypothetical protein
VLVNEIADLVHALSGLVKDTRDLAEALRDGRKYLERHHPEAKAALRDLLIQMRITVVGLATVTAVITEFKFTMGDEIAAAEVSRFNDYVLGRKTEVAMLRGNTSDLKGSCNRVREARDKLNGAAGTPWDFAALFTLLSTQRKIREQELASTLSNIYADDQSMIGLVTRLLDMADAALAEAVAALGPPGYAYPSQVGAAAATLGIYAAAFRQTEGELVALTGRLDKAITILGT